MNKYHDKGIKLRIKKYKRNIRNPKLMGKGNKQTNKQTNKQNKGETAIFLFKAITSPSATAIIIL
jgi:hypothetical protein